ncbi:glucuronate isomerase [Arthrobacter castelli]|uniref:glucuronate isomerase n=1 Tax=Arthrobacter castelli TaxID=271431 RepID=UPI0004060A15|nr:glucuronate isomerase [Arthrobacter castelli]
MPTSIASDPDRLLPAETRTRSIARELLERVDNLPIISPHGHVDPSLLAEDTPFPDPATLLVSPDHYVTRLIHASGVPLDQLRVGGTTEVEPRQVWRRFCEAWPLFDGTASAYWLRSALTHVFGLTEELSASNADATFDTINARLAEPGFRPRNLFKDFNIEVLATTDDPMDELSAHAKLAEDGSFSGKVIPTFRPDSYVKIETPGWAGRVQRLISAAGDGKTGYEGYIRALENRRRHFIEHGAVSTDHGARSPFTCKLTTAEATRIFERALAGDADAADRDVFEGHMMYQMARMSTEDGLVMTIHPGIYRNHHPDTFERFGGDSGHDIPVPVSFTEGLRPLLADFGTAEGFHLVLFTVDETVYSRELAPLAGFYPSVYIGAPWWFLDAPDAMLRFRASVTETAGFSRSSGFIDDTRAFCSIPARHDASRRIEAAFLSRLVAEGRVSDERAHELIVDIVDAAPRRVFKL